MAKINKYEAFVQLARHEIAGNYNVAREIEKFVSDNIKNEVETDTFTSSYPISRKDKKIFEKCVERR